MTVHDGDDTHERSAFDEDDRIREACQQLPTYAELARKLDHGPAFGPRGFERPHRRFELIPELGPQSFTLTFVAIDRVRDFVVRLRVNADRLAHRLAKRASSRRSTTSHASPPDGSASARRARRSSSAS